MADAFVQVAPDSTGAKVDTSSLTVGAQTVHRQRINIADPAGAAALAAVVNSDPAANAYALATREAGRSGVVTYTAVYRLAARPYALSKVFTANTRVQFATIHHPNTSTKTVKLRRVELAIESNTVAAILMADLVRITAAPATGNPAITPTPRFPGDAAADSVCLALPTTAGTEGALYSSLEWNLGATTTAPTTSPPPPLNWQTLLPEVQGTPHDYDVKLPTIRASTLEGYAVVIDANAATTLKGYIVIQFTEE